MDIMALVPNNNNNNNLQDWVVMDIMVMDQHITEVIVPLPNNNRNSNLEDRVDRVDRVVQIIISFNKLIISK